jgi:hypothetical protein
MRYTLAALLMAASIHPALSANFSPVTDTVTKTECGACHMVYPAGLLPARSWDALTTDLAHHFGEDASLSPEVTAQIKQYLIDNAADAKGGNSRILRRLAADATPLKITETPYFVRIHGRFSAKTLGKIGVAGNCTACHGAGAAKGYFGDD